MFPYMSPQTLIIGPFTITNILANTDEQGVYKWREAGEIVDAQIVAQTAIVGNNVNAKVFILKDMTNMSAITNIAVLNLSTGVNLAASVPSSMTETQYTFSKSDILGVNIFGTNAAGDIDELYFIVDYVYGNPASEG